MRRVHHVSGTEPFSLAKAADVGDVSVNPINLLDGLKRIEVGIASIVAEGALPLIAGGDHLTTLPVLRAVARHRSVGMIHFDAHSDTNDTYFGDNPYTHGTPFRRAIEEGLLDRSAWWCRSASGARSTNPANMIWARSHGVRVIYMEDCVRRGIPDVMDEARAIAGDGPTYVSFDIDCIDPSMAPGTGTPEVGGFTTRETQQMLRLLEGVNFVGADVVEVSPPFDLADLTSLAGATMMFELLCVMAKGVWRSGGAAPELSASSLIAKTGWQG